MHDYDRIFIEKERSWDLCPLCLWSLQLYGDHAFAHEVPGLPSGFRFRIFMLHLAPNGGTLSTHLTGIQ